MRNLTITPEYNVDSPERNLLFAIILQAITDAEKTKGDASRKARKFLTGRLGSLRKTCHFLNVPVDRVIGHFKGIYG